MDLSEGQEERPLPAIGPIARCAWPARQQPAGIDLAHTPEPLLERRLHPSTSAIARQGLPDPLTSFSGSTTRTVPTGGSCARFASCVSPYLPAPSMKWWQGKAGSKECATPASVPTVSTPTP